MSSAATGDRLSSWVDFELTALPKNLVLTDFFLF